TWMRFDPWPRDQLPSQDNPNKWTGISHKVYTPDRNHEVAGFIPGLTQWVKDPALLLGTSICPKKQSKFGTFIMVYVPDRNGHRSCRQENHRVVIVSDVMAQDDNYSTAIKILKLARAVSVLLQFLPYSEIKNKERKVH
uniref:Kinesin family member 4A n=1 Tax=Sus scrofa TaxID=9823 RepID=A0A8D1KY11_PIG